MSIHTHETAQVFYMLQPLLVKKNIFFNLNHVESWSPPQRRCTRSWLMGVPFHSGLCESFSTSSLSTTVCKPCMTSWGTPRGGHWFLPSGNVTQFNKCQVPTWCSPPNQNRLYHIRWGVSAIRQMFFKPTAIKFKDWKVC